MAEYGITEEMVINCLYNPDSVLTGLGDRYVAQQRLNSSLVLRVIFEEQSEEVTVVTVYKARAKRYEL